jgi:hypothetical protein
MNNSPQKVLKLLCYSILLASVSSTALAIEDIPEETGVSGFINLGVMGLSVETNMLAETPLNDLGAERISNLTDGPDSESSGIPLVNFELSYTWADSRTQVFIGNRLEDFLRFDFSTLAGVRQGVGNVGIFGIEAISTPIETKVWRDPYEVNTNRQDTSRTSSGARVIWDKIFGSDLEVRYSTREVEIDDELSGTALGLTPADRALLNREGDTNRLDISYAFSQVENNIFVPRLSYIDYDRDGEAMANDGIQLELSHLYKRDRFTYATNLSYGTFDFEEVNPIPIYGGVKNEADRFGLSFTVFWKNVFNLEDWTGSAGVIWFRDDNDIDFYDSQVSAISFSMLHRF